METIDTTYTEQDVTKQTEFPFPEELSNEIRTKANQLIIIQNDVNNVLKGFILAHNLIAEEWTVAEDLSKLIKKA